MSVVPIHLSEMDQVSTSLLQQRSPKAFSSLGGELERIPGMIIKCFKNIIQIPVSNRKKNVIHLIIHS